MGSTPRGIDTLQKISNNTQRAQQLLEETANLQKTVDDLDARIADLQKKSVSMQQDVRRVKSVGDVPSSLVLSSN